jgi:hypothetical protein
VRRDDVDALRSEAQADSASLATRRDVWQPEKAVGLPYRRRENERAPSIWDDDAALPTKRSSSA